MSNKAHELKLAIKRSFSSNQLEDFLHSYFYEVYDDITPGMEKSRWLRKLLDHAENHNKIDYLIESLQRERPNLNWSQFAYTKKTVRLKSATSQSPIKLSEKTSSNDTVQTTHKPIILLKKKKWENIKPVHKLGIFISLYLVSMFIAYLLYQFAIDLNIRDSLPISWGMISTFIFVPVLVWVYDSFKRVNLNKATVNDLMKIKIPRTQAQRLVDFRSNNGDFDTLKNAQKLFSHKERAHSLIIEGCKINTLLDFSYWFYIKKIWQFFISKVYN